MTHDDQLQVGYFDHSTGEAEMVTFRDKWDIDDHNSSSFLVLPDKRIMVCYARHSKNGLFCRTTKAPEEIREWDDEVTIAHTPNRTYSHPAYLSAEGRFYVFWRGETWKPTFSTSEDGKKWSTPKIVIQDAGRNARTIRPYPKVVSDGRPTIHFAFTDGHPKTEPENSVYYLQYREGGFVRADGQRVGTMDDLSIPHSRSDTVYNGRSGKVRAWVWDIALDDGGNPVIAYTRLPQETDHRYHYARWNGESWPDAEVAPGGKWFPQTPLFSTEEEPYYSGGITINHANPAIVYLSRQIAG